MKETKEYSNKNPLFLRTEAFKLLHGESNFISSLRTGLMQNGNASPLRQTQLIPFKTPVALNERVLKFKHFLI